MKWLNKLPGRKNTAHTTEAPQMKAKTSAPQTVFSEEPPLPWDAPTWEKIRSSVYARWYLTQVGAINRYTETYHVTFILTRNGHAKTIELPGSCDYGEALFTLKTAFRTQKNHQYHILDWPHVQPIWGPDNAGQYCWLCEFEETDLVFHVMETEIVKIQPGAVLYGCPFASDIRIPDKSQRPVTVIHFGNES